MARSNTRKRNSARTSSEARPWHPDSGAALAVAIAIAVTVAAPPVWAEPPHGHDSARGVVWLPGDARAIPRTLSASRDAPVLELAYGPRWMASVGAEPGLINIHGESTTWRFGFSALVAAESLSDEESYLGEIWRDVETVSTSLSLDEIGHDLWGGKLELTVLLGHEGAHRSGSEEPVEPWQPTDIPFGGGGWFLGTETAVAIPLVSNLTFTARLGHRFYTNAFPAMVGAHVQSDYVADGLREGLEQLAYTEMTARWRLGARVHPMVSIYSESLIAHDDSAKSGLLMRALLGTAFPGRGGTIVPFTSFEAGNGKGELINRQELRWSGGVRYAW